MMQLTEARQLLHDMEGRYFFINNREETVESTNINEGTLRCIIKTDLEERKCKLSELEEHLQLYKKEKGALATQNNPLTIFMEAPVNNNLNSVEDMLMVSLKKIRNGELDHMPIAMATNKVAGTLISIQKTKIEAAKLILMANKTTAEKPITSTKGKK